MTSPSSLRRPVRRPFHRPVACAAVLATWALIVVGVVVAVLPATVPDHAAASPPTSHARAPGRHEVGYLIKGQWFGSWRVRDGVGFCIEFDQGHPDSTGVRKLGRGRVPGMSAEDSARVAHVVGRYARTRSRVDAAAAAIVVWQTQHTRRFDRYFAKMIKTGKIPEQVQRRIRQITREARLHGPYRLGLSLGAGYVGQTIHGIASVRTETGRPAEGLPVRLTVASTAVLIRSAALTSTVRRTDRSTNRQGRLRFTLTVMRPGTVTVDAILTSPRPSGVWITRPTPGHQRLVLAGSKSNTVRATASSQRSPGRPTLTSRCPSDCAGVAPVTMTVRNPCGAATLRQFVFSNGRPVADGVVDVPACRTGQRTWSLPDAAVVTTRYCYLDAQRHCTTRTVAQPGRFVVVCPPPVQVRSTLTCPCAGPKTVSYSLFGPAGSPRRYVATLIVRHAGSLRQTDLTLRNGSWRSFESVPVPDGATVELRVTVAGRTRLLDRFRQG